MADPYQALYRRYRSKRFSEQRGQEPVMRALRTAVQEGRVGHAYLFSGPRGTGKTSTARILAKVLNCENPTEGEPCGTCPNCIAVDDGRIVDWLLELDAASNNGVANIRELIERIPFGTSGNRKVVILDEVHMLSPGASNALLKTLEDPPPHVLFILATTDPQKVLPTLRSRAQHFEFHLLPAEELAEHVRVIIADAGLDLGEDAVQYVVRQGGGSARDTLSALDQVAAMGGVVDEPQPIDGILAALAERDAGGALVAVADAVAVGRDPRTLGEQLIGRLRDAFLSVMQAPDRHLPEADLDRAAALGASLGPARLTRALEVLGEALVELGKKPDPRIVLEVALVRLCRPEADHSSEALLDRIERLERALAGGAAAPASASDPPAAATEPTAGAADGSAPSTGPAAAARAELAKVRGATAPAPPAAGRPREPVRKATAPPPSPPPAAEPAPASAPPAAAADTAAVAGGTGEELSLDHLSAAWIDVLGGLKKSVRSAYEDAKVTAVDSVGAVLTVSNGLLRAAEMRRADVEAALASRIGRPIRLRVVGGDATEPEPRSATPAAATPDEDEIVDVHALEDAPTAASGMELLVEQFPGSEVLEEP